MKNTSSDYAGALQRARKYCGNMGWFGSEVYAWCGSIGARDPLASDTWFSFLALGCRQILLI